MSSGDSRSSEDRLTAWAEYADMLARGDPPPVDDPALSGPLQDRWEEAQAILLLLEAMRPPGEQATRTGAPEGMQDRVASEATERLPARIGRFEVIDELGRGGCGIVYRARDPLLNRTVALKVPRPEALISAVLRRRFLNEARAAALLDHPHVVRVFEAGELGPVCYIVSAYVEGISLSAWIKRQGRAAPRLAARILVDLAGAIQHAHDRNVLHRDLKPSNVLVLDPEEEAAPLSATERLGLMPRVTDFGLAKLADDESGDTRSGVPFGSPSYMAPEQAAGRLRQIGLATDVYGLGTILYELLTGNAPFRGECAQETIQQVLSTDVVPPRRLDRAIPRALQTICLTCLRKEPGDRYPSAAALADDLERFLAGRAIQARPPGIIRRSASWARRNPWPAAALLLAALAPIGLEWGRAPRPVGNRRVLIETKPSGARVVLAPLDPKTGEPDPSRAIRPARGRVTPVEVVAPSDDYLIVAALASGEFQEVYRRVPVPGEPLRSYRHRRWSERPRGRVALPAIEIPKRSITDGMAYFPGTSRRTPPHGSASTGDDPPFYLDTTEVTVGQYRSVRGSLPPRLRDLAPGAGDPVRFVEYDQAVHYAELLGKRLPTEREHDLAATGGGARAFPWGDSPGPLHEAPWSFGPAGTPAFDHTATHPPVFGLYSNVAEWTSSRPRFGLPPTGSGSGSAGTRTLPGLRAVLPQDPADLRIVASGSFSVAMGRPDPREVLQGPRRRATLSRQPNPSAPGLGFRCARWAHPRFLDAGD